MSTIVAGDRPTEKPSTSFTHTNANMVLILEIAGAAEVLPVGNQDWETAKVKGLLKEGDRFRTKTNSRATLRLSDLSQLRVGEMTEIEVKRVSASEAPPLYKLWKGVIYFFHRERPGRFQFESPNASAAVRGTEFALRVENLPPGVLTILTVLDGEVDLSNPDGQAGVRVGSGEQGIVQPGQNPSVTAMVQAEIRDSVQWVLYYPAVVAVEELRLSAEEETALSLSLEAYKTGDLLRALAGYPMERIGVSAREQVYRAGLLLAVGQVEVALELLDAVDAGDPQQGDPLTVRPVHRLGRALRELVATVKGESAAVTAKEVNVAPILATELLVESYVRQSRLDLSGALKAARQSVAVSTNFSFGWARIAELEFGFGRTLRAVRNIDRALVSGSRNPQTLALRGFLRSAEGKPKDAIRWFNQAIEIDGALGIAWLGRGLSLIRTGHAELGLEDLQTAVVHEPQRALFRSYLGKGYERVRRGDLAEGELELAKNLDPADPTAWLYSALLKRDQNRINEAVADLERSVQLNDRRAIYRSRFLLDGDRAVRSSSLANVYQRAGMSQVGMREAVRAVSYDYANYSAHLFLSESFNQLRDPTRFNLRFETVWFNELLLANLLSPVGGTPLSQNISQLEYGRLFERNRLGLSSSSEYRTDGQFVQLASQFGTFGNTSWSLDLDYQHNNGVRPNNELDRIEWYTTVKQQLSPQDSVLLLTKYQEFHAGDNLQYYDPANPRRQFNWDEYQRPIAVAGYHREWSPGVHSLVLGGRLASEQLTTDPASPHIILWKSLNFDPNGRVVTREVRPFDLYHQIELEIYTAEVQQIVENEHHALLFGTRLQAGEFDTYSLLSNPPVWVAEFQMPAAEVHAVDDFERISAYVYETLKLPGRLRLTGGLTYDHIVLPINFRGAPIQEGERSEEQLSPKAALVWDVHPTTTLRGVYSRSLGGVSLDESYRLEPTQLGGFSQAFRTLIPESLVGSVAVPDHEVVGGALDLKFKTHTYIGVQAEMLRSDVERTVGVFDFFFNRPQPVRMIPSGTPQLLDYVERSFTFTLNQLISDEWAVGAQYSFVSSDLRSRFPETFRVSSPLSSTTRAELQRVNLSLLYNHPSGFYGSAEAWWYYQQTIRSTSDLPSDSFEHVNFFVGYRFPRQLGDVQVGILNVLDQDYRLNPVTPYQELPRERVLSARLRFRF